MVNFILADNQELTAFALEILTGRNCVPSLTMHILGA